MRHVGLSKHFSSVELGQFALSQPARGRFIQLFFTVTSMCLSSLPLLLSFSLQQGKGSASSTPTGSYPAGNAGARNADTPPEPRAITHLQITPGYVFNTLVPFA